MPHSTYASLFGYRVCRYQPSQHRGSIILLISSGAAKITSAHHSSLHERRSAALRTVPAGICLQPEITFPKCRVLLSSVVTR